MTEEQAIKRIDAALRKVLPNHVWTDRIALTAWNEMKAIAREDALTVHLPSAAEAKGRSVTAWNRDGKSLAARAHRSDAKRGTIGTSAASALRP